MTDSRTPGVEPPVWDNIPPELAQRPQWLLWRFEAKAGQAKPLKVPYWATGARRGGTQGSEVDRAKLVTLPEARRVFDRGGYSGVGFAFLPGDGLIGRCFVGVGVDLYPYIRMPNEIQGNHNGKA